jgi:hypothetical protein
VPSVALSSSCLFASSASLRTKWRCIPFVEVLVVVARAARPVRYPDVGGGVLNVPLTFMGRRF